MRQIEANWNQACAKDEILLFKRGVVRTALNQIRYEGDADRLVNQIRACTLVHPGWTSLHSVEMRKVLRQEEINRLICTLSDTNELSLEPEDCLRTVFRHSLIRQSGRATAKRATKVSYQFADPAEISNLKPMARESLELLLEVWPEQHTLATQLISHLIFFKAAREWSSSETLTFGTIYYNSEFGREPIHLAEGLIHEMGHHSLYIKQTFKPPLTNPEALCRSPLREDLRPAIGLLHAVFILRRILQFYERVDQVQRLRSLIPEKRVEQYRSNLQEGLEILKSVGRFTSFGQALFDSI